MSVDGDVVKGDESEHRRTVTPIRLAEIVAHETIMKHEKSKGALVS